MLKLCTITYLERAPHHESAVLAQFPVLPHTGAVIMGKSLCFLEIIFLIPKLGGFAFLSGM